LQKFVTSVDRKDIYRAARHHPNLANVTIVLKMRVSLYYQDH